jgi:hypothetical protein
VTTVADLPDVTVARLARAEPARLGPVHAEYARAAITAGASGRLASELIVIAQAHVTSRWRCSAATLSLRSRR